MKAYQCQHSGLYYPESYVKEWGVNGNGVGMGPVPVSDVLDSQYHQKKVPINIHKPEEGEMHPFGLCKAGLILVDVSEENFNANKAIMHKDDPQFLTRREILKEKQLARRQGVN